MSQPHTQHRREIWQSLCVAYGVVSGIEWDKALASGLAVGTCSACQGVMKPLPAENRGQRVVYPARCAGCGREVEGMGPRVEKSNRDKE